MKQFAAARLISASRGPSNQQIHLQDSIGRTLELNLSPQAQAQLLEALLSNAPLVQGTPTSGSQHLKIQAAKCHMLGNGDCGLELFLGPNKAIRIAFDPSGLPAFQKALESFANPGSWDTSKPN